MKKYILTAIGSGIILTAFISPGITEEPAAKPPGVDEIVNRTNRSAYYQGKDGLDSATLTTSLH